MNTKTMEGIVGARANMNLLRTPMRVYKEARRKGDTATMERAMGYACECSDRAEEYKEKADKGMEEDAKEAREKEKAQREEAIRKRREERGKMEERIEEDSSADAGESGTRSPEIGEDEKVPSKDGAQEPVGYTKAGAPIMAEQSSSISVFV
ncbi:MAG: hypothetical protein K1W26_10465 [Acetatifactor sp.]